MQEIAAERSALIEGRYAVPWEQLCWRCSTDKLNFEKYRRHKSARGFVGQDRALNAIRFGLEVDKPGYNLFVTGLTGTGRTSAISSIYSSSSTSDRDWHHLTLNDWCYLHTLMIRTSRRRWLPAGKGKRLHVALERLLAVLRDQLPKTLAPKNTPRNGTRSKKKAGTSIKLPRRPSSARWGGALRPSVLPVEVNLFPLNDQGAPLSPEAYMRLSESERQRIEETRDKLFELVHEAMDKLADINRETRDKLRELERRVGESALARIFSNLSADWKEHEQVTSYLSALKDHTLNNLRLFLTETPQVEPRPSQPMEPLQGAAASAFLPFEVNVRGQRDHQRGPVIVESNPTWSNLLDKLSGAPW
jgi:hypothetical protein